MLALAIFSAFIFCALSVMLAIALTNLFVFPQLSDYISVVRQAKQPVSILIPARDEAARLPEVIRSLLAQDYPCFEVIVLDDNSCDGTCEAGRNVALDDERLKCVIGKPLPKGWVGKSWACHQLAELAAFDCLLFTDADVVWRPGALQAVMNAFSERKPGLLTVWPTQRTVTWCERLVVPLMAFAIHAYLPAWLAHRSPYPIAAAANGQCMVFSRASYELAGGHASVRGSVLEDVLLARQVKADGDKLWMVEGDGLIVCRMYVGCGGVVDGYTKNILAGHGSMPAALVASGVFHIAVFVAPSLWLLSGIVWPSYGWPVVPLLLYLFGVSVRAVTAHNSHQRIFDSFLMPLSALGMTYIAVRALLAHYRFGGPEWKGRRIPFARTKYGR